MKIKLKRVYDPPSKEDGVRIFVDRLWPRGLKKSELTFDLWLKQAAPSPPLRKWFSHDPAKWKEFQKEYQKELEADLEGWQPIADALKKGNVTLLYAAKDEEHSHALCLKNYLEKKIETKKKSQST